MEIQVKFTLRGRDDFDKFQQFAASGFKGTLRQHNFFFDHPYLRSHDVVVRLRQENGINELTVKEHAQIDAGESLRFSAKASLSDSEAQTAIVNPDSLLSILPSEIKETFAQRYSVTSLTALGSFVNIRNVFEVEGMVVYLDESEYSSGTVYEIEVVDNNSNTVSDMAEQFADIFVKLGMQFQPSQHTKFQHFVASLPNN